VSFRAIRPKISVAACRRVLFGEGFEALGEGVAAGEAQPPPLHIEEVPCDALVAFDLGALRAFLRVL
jgi:hypothetical protein